MIIYLSLFGLGILARTLSIFIGIGGGAIIVPVLYLYFKMAPELAIAISLMMIGVNSTINVFKYRPEESSEASSWRDFLIFGAFGVIAGHGISLLLASETKETLLFVLLAIVLVKTVISLIKKEKSQKKEIANSNLIHLNALFFSALIARITGLGGGVLYIPVLQYLGIFSIENNLYNANRLMMISSFFGLATMGLSLHLEQWLHMVLPYGGILILSGILVQRPVKSLHRQALRAIEAEKYNKMVRIFFVLWISLLISKKLLF